MKYSDVMDFLIDVNNLVKTYGNGQSKEYMRVIMDTFVSIHGPHFSETITKNGFDRYMQSCVDYSSRESNNKTKFKECLQDTIQKHKSKNIYDSGLTEDEIYNMLSSLQGINEDPDISDETREFNGRIMEEKNVNTASNISDLKIGLDRIINVLDHIANDL